MKRPDIVRRIAEVVHRIAPDAKTILYGSEARGDEVEVETGVIISPMVVLRRVWERITTPFSINVMKEGIVL